MAEERWTTTAAVLCGGARLPAAAHCQPTVATQPAPHSWPLLSDGAVQVRMAATSLLLLLPLLATATTEQQTGARAASLPLAEQEACKGDMAVLQHLCGASTEKLNNNWAVLACIEQLPQEKQLSPACENLVWQFKLDVTKQDVFLEQAKVINVPF